MGKTLLLIKPNVTRENKIGAVIKAIEENGLVVKNMKMEILS